MSARRWRGIRGWRWSRTALGLEEVTENTILD